MSVLLRQPHGFEGFGVIPEELDDATILPLRTRARRRSISDVRLRRRWPAPRQMSRDDDSVAGVDEVADRFHGVGVPGLAHAARTSRMTASRPTKGPGSGQPLAEVARSTSGSCSSANGIHVARVPRLEGGSHDLHVLLRHRPRSIPQAQESA